ncbi:VOC family protein [Phytomonospora endophytica]|uniref:Catechol 2,3-dioxygenase-like lactoylglutathione lyase family enzyme n=1 Tax=Phytomonospora endophytica TaxID=714109 RepID=A0A841FJ67_9ACTN|nr:VOC family protein [Phytomonospora endophytica]MBB6033878.1 catechol 2,3-dioxygenase-like lactoylglutathione lyase family enzyme [Phytomonospora endophytica]GIG64602.1 glyoxalase [Phytomonospora endophytica]
MNWTLEVVILPVSDIDRAKEFYTERLGFVLDHDSHFGDAGRVVQVTPPGSGCSVVFGSGPGLPEMEPGSIKGVQLVVNDIRAAHAELTARGVDVSPVQIAAPEGFRSAEESDTELNNVGFVSFADPDGNEWAVQEISGRP